MLVKHFFGGLKNRPTSSFLWIELFDIKPIRLVECNNDKLSMPTNNEIMKNTIILISIILFLFMSHHEAYAQNKFEKENRIKVEEVPAMALDFVEALDVEKKIRWYSEIGLDSKSVEAKFKKEKTRYSIEFDTTGSIQDAELEISWIDIPAMTKATISSELGDICAKYKTRKIQIQYGGDPSNLLIFLQGDGDPETVSTRYELVVKCKNKNNVELFEYLFSDDGELLESAIIVFKNSSNLEY